MLSDSELFLHWAAEAFVAAGRAPDSNERQARRNHALLFSDIFRELDKIEFVGPAGKSRPESSAIGQLLTRAFPLADNSDRA